MSITGVAILCVCVCLSVCLSVCLCVCVFRSLSIHCAFVLIIVMVDRALKINYLSIYLSHQLLNCETFCVFNNEHSLTLTLSYIKE